MPENEELVDDNDELIDLSAKANDHTSVETEPDDDSDAIDLAPYIYPAASFFIPLIVYWRTMCQALYIGDGGDFITASHTLGLPHPPGYPLYTLLGTQCFDNGFFDAVHDGDEGIILCNVIINGLCLVQLRLYRIVPRMAVIIRVT